MQINGTQPAKTGKWLFWEDSDRSWNVGPSFAIRDAKFKAKKGSYTNEKCPADPNNIQAWTYSGSLSWHNDKHLQIECALENFHA